MFFACRDIFDVVFFFFKQKTAYEIVSGDWSSDVCSSDLPSDFRRRNPRFQGEAFEQNLRLVDRVRAIADEKGVTAGQLALAWVMAQSDRDGNPTVVPIPGTKRVGYLEENAAAADVDLTEDDLRRID